MERFVQALDYIRIVGISEIHSGGSDHSDITFNIEYSGDADFSVPKMGVITLRLDELLGTTELGRGDMEKIGARLIRQVLLRERIEDGSIVILHILGMPLGEWLMKNTPLLRQ
jgi:hypothetical protein